jgi:hypothetical protein
VPEGYYECRSERSTEKAGQGIRVKCSERHRTLQTVFS